VLDVFIRAYIYYLESQYVYPYRWFWVAFLFSLVGLFFS
jgi:uncharacterized membrane protein